jgi:hypothetical protein
MAGVVAKQLTHLLLLLGNFYLFNVQMEVAHGQWLLVEMVYPNRGEAVVKV